MVIFFQKTTSSPNKNKNKSTPFFQKKMSSNFDRHQGHGSGEFALEGRWFEGFSWRQGHGGGLFALEGRRFEGFGRRQSHGNDGFTLEGLWFEGFDRRQGHGDRGLVLERFSNRLTLLLIRQVFILISLLSLL